jgi:cytidylate kinase
VIIAIDGPAAAGKGTLARRLAERFSLAYLDTGSLYRAIAAKMLRNGDDPGNQDLAAKTAESLESSDLDAPDLRTEAVGAAASEVAAHPAVRQVLIGYQRRFAAADEGAILDGRDIGTVILPDADIKIFVTASAEARADRRHKELRDKGVESIRAAVLREMAERDSRDRARVVAPLTAAPDAFLLDTTNLDADAAFAAAVEYVLAHGT